MGSSERIGIVYFGAYPDIRVEKFARTLASAGHEVVVLCRSCRGGASDTAADGTAGSSRVTVRRLLDGYDGRCRGVLTMPYPVNALWRRAIRDLIDTDHCRALIVRDIPLAPAVLWEAARRGVPVLLDMAENYPAALAVWRRCEGPVNYVKNALLRNVALARATERYACRRAAAVAVVAEESAERVTALGTEPARVHVIENTPDLAWLAGPGPAQPAGHPAGEGLVAIYTGEIHTYRGIDTCIRALAEPGSAGVTMCLVGKGKREGQLKGLASRMGVQPAVRWVGWQPHDRMMAMVAGADVGVVPHHASPLTQYTMPNKLYDYMGCAKPVVVSDVRPMQRVVRSTQCGVTFRAGDPRDLSRALGELADPLRRQEMGENGRRAVEERYNWTVDGARLVEAVRSLVR